MTPEQQKYLIEIQQAVVGSRDECKLLDDNVRIHDTVARRQGMEEVIGNLRQSLQGMMSLHRADAEALSSFREKVMALMRATDRTVRTYMRSKAWRMQTTYRGTNQMPSQEEQDAISAPVVLPSPFLEQAVAGFADALCQYQGCIAELERAMASIMQQRPRRGGGGGGGLGIGEFADEASLQQQLPVIISHMHDYFTHVAAQLEKLHSEVRHVKEAFLDKQRARGDMTDPFQQSRRQQQHHFSN
ncbi:MAG: hypothetical protein WDW36_000670 [Sanguina aurantia]